MYAGRFLFKALFSLGALTLCHISTAITPEEIESRNDVVSAPLVNSQPNSGQQNLPGQEIPDLPFSRAILLEYRDSESELINGVVEPEPVLQPQYRAEPEPEPEVEPAPQVVRAQPSASSVPAGFEAFLQEQTTLVDVHFGGRYVYSGLATFDPQTIRFNDPDALLNSIPGLSDTTPLLARLSGPLPNNEGMKCIVEFQSNCGFIDTDSIDLIFDPATYQATIFVSPQYQSLQLRQVSRYLPPSTSGLAFLQTLNITATGSDRSDEVTQNFNGRTIIGFGGSNLQMVSNYSTTGDFEIDDFLWQRDAAGKRYSAGILSNDRENLDFANQYDLIGISVGTNLNTREDLRLTTGNRIQVFLPSRARVSIYKDDRLFSTEVLEAGNQELDTSSLPGGSYEVELRIDDGSGERIETRFYSKNSRLPPADEAQYSLTIGQFRDQESNSITATQDRSILSGSYLRRTGDNSALRLGAVATEDSYLIESGWFQASRGFEIEIGGSITDQEDYGLSADLVTSLFGSTLTAEYREVWNDSYDPLVEEASLLGETSRQVGANLSLPFFNGGINLSARINRREDEDRETYSLNYRFAPWSLGAKSSLSPRFQYTQQNGLDTFLFTLTLQQNGDNWRISQSSQYENQETSMGVSQASVPLRVAANWTSPDTWKSIAQVGLDASRQSADDAAVGANMDWRGAFGKALLNVDQGLLGDDKALSWGGSYHTSVVMTDSTWGYGGRVQNNSALLIDLTAVDAEDVYFDVLVNNRSRGTADPGTTTIITLPPYETYEVRLAARGLGFVSMIDRTETVTLYPGNAERLVWEIEQIDIVFGRFIDSQNNPIAGALVRGVEGLAVTDDLGNFQAELSSSTDELIAETRTHSCTAVVPDYQANDGIGFLGDIQCVLSPKAGVVITGNAQVQQPRPALPQPSAPVVPPTPVTVAPAAPANNSVNAGEPIANCPAGSNIRVIQLASFSNLQSARMILEELGVSPAFIEVFTPDNGATLYRVVVGPYEEAKEDLVYVAEEIQTETGWEPWIKDKDCSDLRRLD